MAIVNVTGDSFYPGSRLGTERRRIAAHVDRAMSEGARILDIGACSTRPGAAAVDEQQELGALRTALDVVRKRFPDAAVSIDTWRAGVARQIMDEFGPCILNDITAGEADPDMIPLAAERGVPYVAMHMRGNPQTMNMMTDYPEGVVDGVVRSLRDKLSALRGAGVERVILDPGFGFAKTLRQNHELLAGLRRIAGLGVPVLAGLSRKSMIYKVCGGGPGDALPGTAALNWQALCNGAKILRVHDVKAAADVVKLFEYYTGNGE